MRVVGERLDDVRACVDEVAVQLGDDLRVLEHDFGNEGARLQIAAPLELEYVAFGADDRALVETLEEGETRRSGCSHDEGGRASGVKRDYRMFSAAASPSRASD